MTGAGAISGVVPGGNVLLAKPEVDIIAARIDVGLCELCGDMRMRDHAQDDDDLPGAVIAERLTQVRRDIADMVQDNRNSFAELDRRLQGVCEQVRRIELARATEEGKLTGVKTTLGVLITISTLLGALVSWVISHLPWGTPKP